MHSGTHTKQKTETDKRKSRVIREERKEKEKETSHRL